MLSPKCSPPRRGRQGPDQGWLRIIQKVMDESGGGWEPEMKKHHWQGFVGQRVQQNSKILLEKNLWSFFVVLRFLCFLNHDFKMFNLWCSQRCGSSFQPWRPDHGMKLRYGSRLQKGDRLLEGQLCGGASCPGTDGNWWHWWDDVRCEGFQGVPSLVVVCWFIKPMNIYIYTIWLNINTIQDGEKLDSVNRCQTFQWLDYGLWYIIYI